MAVPVPGSVPVAKEGVTMDEVLKLIKASTSKNVDLRDLPTYTGQSPEDANHFLVRLERCGTAYGWSNDDYLKYISLTIRKSLFDGSTPIKP